jgi:hypothetical protein
VKGPTVRSLPWRPARGPAVMLPESQHDSSGLSEMAPTMSVPGRRSRTYPRCSAHWPLARWRWSRARRRPVPRLRPLVTRKSRVGPFCAGFPGPSVVRFGAADCVEPQSSASRVVCRCRERPQAVSGCLKSAATLTNRSGEGASCCALRATSSKRGPRGPKADVGSGDESPREMD